MNAPLSGMRLLFIICVSFFGVASAIAQTTPWYHVEVMLIAYLDETRIKHESWPIVLADTTSAVAENKAEPGEFDGRYQWWINSSSTPSLWSDYSFSQPPESHLHVPLQPLQTLLMSEKADRINDRSDMQVIWHQAWVEPVQAEQKAVPHVIDEQLTRNMDIRITGHFHLHLSRYLHINTDLIVRHYALDGSVILKTLHLPVSRVMKTLSPLMYQNMTPIEQRQMPVRAGRVQQSRRMRSNELHYIDHPMLGVVVKVTPVDKSFQTSAKP